MGVIRNWIKGIAAEAINETQPTVTINSSYTDATHAVNERLYDMLHPTVNVMLDDGAHMLVRAHFTDAGADIRCVYSFEVPAHDSIVINTGIHVELPQNTVGMIKSKSGLNVRSCIVVEGVIDEGYDGAILLRIYNHGDYSYHFEAGDKVTQLVVMPVVYPTYRECDKIQGGERGDGGFGSTGR